MIGKNLSNTQVKGASGVVKQCSHDSGRGARMDPPKGAQLPGKGNKQTRNSPSNRA